MNAIMAIVAGLGFIFSAVFLHAHLRRPPGKCHPIFPLIMLVFWAMQLGGILTGGPNG